MRKTKFKPFVASLAVMLCMAAFSMPAFASGGDYYSSDENGSNTPPDSIDSITVSTEDVNLSKSKNEQALTPDGNLSLVDDIYQVTTYESDETELEAKQFITVQSKNGNYFYLIIDRIGDSENVYFLNMVDEADLLALMDDVETVAVCSCTDKCVAGSVNTNCDICKSNMSDCAGKETVTVDTDTSTELDDATEEPTEEATGSKLGVLLIVLIIAGGGGAFYYFKVLKNKPKTNNTPNMDDYDFGNEDDEEYEIEEDNDELDEHDSDEN